MKYELWIEGVKDKCGNLDDLIDKAVNQKQYYEIFQVIKSNMGYSTGIKKMNIEEMKEANRLNEKGYSRKVIGMKFGVSSWYIDKVLRQIGNQ